MSVTPPYSHSVKIPLPSPVRILITDPELFTGKAIHQVRKERSWYEISFRSQTLDAILPYLLANPQTDMVIMELVPGDESAEICRKLQKRYPGVNFLFVCSSQDPEQIKWGIRAGGMGTLCRNNTSDELYLAVEQIREGIKYYAPAIKDVLVQAIEEEILQKNEPEVEGLTRREVEVLKLLGYSMTAQEIADELHISKHTVETHRRNLLNKLGVKNSLALVRFAIKKGFAN